MEVICDRKQSVWNGAERLDFTVEGRPGILVRPENPVTDGAGRLRWIWRTEFFDAFPSLDKLLVERGWCVAYHMCSNLYGNPLAISQFKTFYDAVVPAFGLSEQPVMEGFSRGGLYAVNFAYAYPQLVSALYLDAPVLDVRNWPLGLGSIPVYPSEAQQCLDCYGLTWETAKTFDESPLNRAEFLVEHKIPVLMVAGLKDSVVNYEENGGAFVERYQKAGGTIRVFLKPECDHHPHSLEDAAPLADWLEEIL